MGVHEDISRKGETERSLTPLPSVVFAMKWDAYYLNEK
jgi:hypothetical protein